MIGFAIGLLTFFITTAASEAHKSAKQRMDALFMLFTDALRTVSQLDEALASFERHRAYLAATEKPARERVSAYFAVDPTALSIDLAQSLRPDESALTLRYVARWKRLAGLLERYEAQFAHMYLGKDPFTRDDVDELSGTIANAARTAAELRVIALTLCKRWLEASYLFAGREPDPDQDSEGRWTSVSDLDSEIVARERELDGAPTDQSSRPCSVTNSAAPARE